MLGFSVRTVDNLMARGLPHCTVGKRRCRFDRAEVRDWFKQTYSAQRLGKGAHANLRAAHSRMPAAR